MKYKENDFKLDCRGDACQIFWQETQRFLNMYEKCIKTGLLLEKKDGSRILSVEFKKVDSHLHKFVVRFSSGFPKTYWEWSFLQPVTAFSLYRKLSRYCFPKEEKHKENDFK